MFIGICSRSQVSVYRTIGPLVMHLTIVRFSIYYSHDMAPKMIILLYVYSKQPCYNMVSLLTKSVSMDPKDSIIMRLTCEPPHGKTNNLHRRKQRRRSASQ